MKSKYDYTIKELIDLGANVTIRFHRNENIAEANEKIELFDDAGELEMDEHDGVFWLKSEGDVEIVAFHKGDA